MKTINHLYSSEQRLESFLSKSGIDDNKQLFIQVFIGNNDPEALQEVLNIINRLLPSSSVIATSTAGEIVEGGMLENTTVISLTTFNATDIHVGLIEAEDETQIANKILDMTSDRTKLIIAFNNVYANDGEEILNVLSNKRPDIKIAGGNAGDNGVFNYQTTVGANDKISTSGIAVAVFDSDVLQVFNDLLFNWQTIGEPMVVTKADKSCIYEIDNQKAQEVYRYFLGDDVARHLPLSGIEFPLIFNEDGLDIARAPVAAGDDGSLIMAGHIKEGSTVKFGFGDVEQNDINVIKTIKSFAQKPVESIFVYSCSARKYFLKEHLNSEFSMLNRVAPTAGFVTYGEFFKQNECNKMLNVSSTFIGLSENPDVKHDIDFKSTLNEQSVRTLNALTHLVKQTSKNVEKKNLSLSQFQSLIKDSTLYSATDTKGIITDVNERFVELSGYSRDELIGKAHNIVRHPAMPSDVYKDMWDTIKAKKTWTGVLKNRTKNGKNYYVRASIFPILDVNGEITQYISIRDDITEEMQRKELLEGTLDYLEEKTKEKDYLLGQYENIINLSSSFFRIDPEFHLLHVNSVFCEIYGSSENSMIKKSIVDILEPEFAKNEFDHIRSILVKENTWSGVMPFRRENGTVIHMDTSVNTIFDKKGNLAEFMVVMHDITDLIVAQKEITDTQKDVVYTMGAIGESRSKETGNHVKRVAEYSKVLAIHCGIDEDEAELLKMASPMHDIGKVGIPDSILNKPGKLTDKEWKIMKTHSALGYQMLKSSKREILKAAAIVAYTHHEQWDGNGYPRGLKGEEIHIYGRITALADVFDALGSDRCYKKAWEDEKIFELIKNGKGTQFDPALVDIFFDNLDTFLEIRSKFKD